MKTREPRHKVVVRARMRDGSTWQDVTIQNVSSRGMLIRAGDTSPARGAYVEVRRLDQVIVARVVWQKGTVFGCRTQDGIDIGRLTSAQGASTAKTAANDDPAPDRRRKTRGAIDAAERNQLLGRSMQWVALAAGGGCAALVVGLTIWETLSKPAEQIGKALN